MGDAGSLEICTRTTRFWLDVDGILHMVVLPNVEESLADAKENRLAVTRFVVDGRLPPRLLDLRGMKSSSREAQDYNTSSGRPGETEPVALIIDSGYSRVAANFFIALRRPWMTQHPNIRFFASESEALIWLRGLLNG